MPDITPYLKDILAASVEGEAFAFDDESLARLAADSAFGVLPEFVLATLRTMEEIEYPTEPLFRAAVSAKIVDQFLEKGAPPNNEKTLKGSAGIAGTHAPPAFVAAVETVAGRHFDSGRARRDALSKALAPLIDPYLTPLVKHARTSHPFLQTSRNDWSGGSCGCVLAQHLPGATNGLGGQRQPGVVYGLFPVWQAGREELIDFSVLSNVGYYAVPFDDAGNLLDPLAALQDDDHKLDFVDTAHRHGVQVDWIIRRVDWSSWARLDIARREKAFHDLATHINEMLQERSGHWLRRLASTLSFGTIPEPTRGDGVTLYFDNYPEDDASIASFAKFHQRLNDLLRESIGDTYSVNLLLPATAIGTGIHQCDRLLGLLYGPNGNTPRNNGKFLVFITEPTIDTKKDLRRDIENCETGGRRKDLQQSIVPVIQYDGYGVDQLTDDVVYFDFNFGGVGLWPHPVASEVDDSDAAPTGKAVTAEEVGGDIRHILLGETTKPGTLQRLGTGFCNFVCPNRWIFRGLFETFLTILLLSFVLRWANCSLDFALKARPIYFYAYMAGVVAPTVGLFLSLLYCDPAWSDVREGNIPFLLLAFVSIGYVIWLYVDARRQASKP